MKKLFLEIFGMYEHSLHQLSMFCVEKTILKTPQKEKKMPAYRQLTLCTGLMCQNTIRYS